MGLNGFIAINANQVIHGEEGTIMLWVRPHWDYPVKTGNEPHSHTFLSFSWDDPKNGYFVISDGWWEKSGGRKYAYCIFNNQDSAKTEKRLVFDQGRWVHFACSWKSGTSGFMRFYVNGLLVGESYKKPTRKLKPRGMIYVGSDKGTPMAEGRWGDCDVDELAAFPRALNDRDILSAYLACAADQKTAKDDLGNSRIRQIRAIFDEGTGWMTEQGARETIDRIKRAGFNVYIPCVWHGMGTRYPSTIAPAELNLRFIGQDPLERLITLAHDKGIEVHPWFCVTLRQREFLSGFYDKGTPEKAFDIHKPQFREFIVSLIIDVVKRYDVDGINLDYIRSMGICTSSFCRTQYRTAFTRDLLADMENTSREKGLEPHIQEWIDAAVESVVKDVSMQGKKMKSSLLISVDGGPIPQYLPPSDQGRQEVQWANKGYIDIIFNMDYRINPDFERLEFIKTDLNQSEKLIPLLGNYDRICYYCEITPRKADVLSSLVSCSLKRYPYGFGIYTYSQLSDEQIDALSKHYPDHSTPPEIK